MRSGLVSKKHFIAIAAALKAMRLGASPEQLATISSVAFALASVFAGFNPLFDRPKFLVACGVKTRPEHTES